MHFISIAAFAAVILGPEVLAQQRSSYPGLSGAYNYELDAGRTLDDLVNRCPALDITGASQRCRNAPDNVLSKFGFLEVRGLKEDAQAFPGYPESTISDECDRFVKEFQRFSLSIHANLPNFKKLACEPTKIGTKKQMFADAISKRLDAAGKLHDAYKARAENTSNCKTLNSKIDDALNSIQADTDEISPYLEAGGELMCLGL